MLETYYPQHLQVCVMDCGVAMVIDRLHHLLASLLNLLAKMDQSCLSCISVQVFVIAKISQLHVLPAWCSASQQKPSADHFVHCACLPALAGIVVAVADRLDSLVGLTAAVGAPSATADPYGLRRAAYGMLQALVSNSVGLSLKAAVDAAAALQPIQVGAEYDGTSMGVAVASAVLG